MRVIWSWLKEFVDFEGSPEELTQVLTMNGIESGNVERVGKELEPILIGEILQISPHPRSDKLQVCSVFNGLEKKTVVCGAPNIASGQRVPVIPPGTLLPSGKTIDTTEIQGVLSEGMICSASELGFQDEQDGIWILDENYKVGMSLSQAASLYDYVFDVEVTPNRGDCLSILGIAREVACNKKIPFFPAKTRVSEQGDPLKDIIRISVETPSLCPRYTARVIQDVEVGISPILVQWRLHHSGIRPINSVVDATNYVMLERGQPLHAFDLEKIKNDEIIVRGWTGDADETFRTLDNVERSPVKGACMICDGAGPIAIGGIMGGMDSEVDFESTSILIESAHFQPESVRSTARSLGLSTEASYRFERGVNPGGTLTALDHVAKLIQQTAGGRAAQGFVDIHQTSLLKNQNISLRIPQIERILGLNISIGDISEILTSLDLEVEPPVQGQEQVSVQIPLHRPDLTREIDIIEEVARIYGYDRLPTTLPPFGEIRFTTPSEWDLLCRVNEVLSGAGLVETVNLSFVPDHGTPVGQVTDVTSAETTRETIQLLNPISQEATLLRPNLWPGLLKNAATNSNHNVQDIQIYEAGRVFLPRPSVTSSDCQPIEPLHIAALMNRGNSRSLWAHKNQGRDFFDIKGMLEHLCNSFGIVDITFRLGSIGPFHPTRSAMVYYKSEDMNREEKIGEVGEIHPDLLRFFDITQPIYLFEIRAEPLRDAMRRAPRFHPLPKFPATSRDLAIIVRQEVSMENLRCVILETGFPLIRSVEAFDVHTGDNISEGSKSIAFALEYRSEEKTLTGEEVSEVHDQIITKLADVYQAELR